MSLVATLRERGLVAVLDVEVGDALRSWGLAVKEGGIEVLAVPVSHPSVTETVAELSDEADLVVGITGVVAAEQVSVAVAAGVELVVSPIADRDIIEAAKQRGLTIVAGATTPTEVAWAASAGADLVSLHPIGFATRAEDYLASMLRTFPELPLAVSGGVGVDNAPTFLAAGASAVFVDHGLFPEVGDPSAQEILTTRALALVEVAADVLGRPARSSLAAHRAQKKPARGQRPSRPPRRSSYPPGAIDIEIETITDEEPLG